MQCKYNGREKKKIRKDFSPTFPTISAILEDNRSSALSTCTSAGTSRSTKVSPGIHESAETRILRPLSSQNNLYLSPSSYDFLDTPHNMTATTNIKLFQKSILRTTQKDCNFQAGLKEWTASRMALRELSSKT